jgi:hypothetical protein
VTEHRQAASGHERREDDGRQIADDEFDATGQAFGNNR